MKLSTEVRTCLLTLALDILRNTGYKLYGRKYIQNTGVGRYDTFWVAEGKCAVCVTPVFLEDGVTTGIQSLPLTRHVDPMTFHVEDVEYGRLLLPLVSMVDKGLWSQPSWFGMFINRTVNHPNMEQEEDYSEITIEELETALREVEG